MKIQLAMILFAVFNTAYSLPLKINPECRKLAMKGFPFYGKESVTLSQMVKNHEKTGLGAEHLAQQKIDFQKADKNENGLLELDEVFFEEYLKMKQGENLKDFEFMDKDKNGLVSLSEFKSYNVALNLLDPYISDNSLKTIYGVLTGPDGEFNYEEYLKAVKFGAQLCFNVSNRGGVWFLN